MTKKTLTSSQHLENRANEFLMTTAHRYRAMTKEEQLHYEMDDIQIRLDQELTTSTDNFRSKKNKLLQTFENEINDIRPRMEQEFTTIKEETAEEELTPEQMQKLLRLEDNLITDKVNQFRILESNLITEEMSRIKPGIKQDEITAEDYSRLD